jgi:hypothetical protein
MSLQTWDETLKTLPVGGTAVATNAADTSLLLTTAGATDCKITLPANYFSIGKTIRIKMCLRVSNIVTTPGTLTLKVLFGAVVVFNGGAMQLSTTAHTTLPVWVEILLTCRAVGSGTNANLMGQGMAVGQPLMLTAVADSTTSLTTLLMPNTTPTVGTGFDSTATQAIDLTANFSLTGNSTTLEQYTIEAMN